MVWHVLGRLLVRARSACNIPSSGCTENGDGGSAKSVLGPRMSIYIPFFFSMIAVAGGSTNAMNVSKNVRAWRCTRCPARLHACCLGGGLLLLFAWASADVRQVLLQQPHASQVKLALSPKQRTKPAASRTRTCINSAVCIASGECPSRF